MRFISICRCRDPLVYRFSRPMGNLFRSRGPRKMKSSANLGDSATNIGNQRISHILRTTPPVVTKRARTKQPLSKYRKIRSIHERPWKRCTGGQKNHLKQNPHSDFFFKSKQIDLSFRISPLNRLIDPETVEKS